MTTPAAARLYLAQHLLSIEGKRWAVFNPNNEPLENLPVIYGFNNGGTYGCYDAVLLAEDGYHIGGHTCSDEGYMPHDLGIVEGSRPARHEEFRKHYPDGYRMEFVKSSEVEQHKGLMAAFEQNKIMCQKCKSKGFNLTKTGCTFCDGTEGGNPPKMEG